MFAIVYSTSSGGTSRARACRPRRQHERAAPKHLMLGGGISHRKKRAPIQRRQEGRACGFQRKPFSNALAANSLRDRWITSHGSAKAQRLEAALTFKLRIVRHRSKSSKHGCSGFRIASTNECYRSCMAKYFPIALRALYRRRGSGTFEGFTRN